MFRETSSWEGCSVLYRNVQNTVLCQIRPQAPGRNNPSLLHSKIIIQIYKMHANSNYEKWENMNRLIEKKTRYSIWKHFFHFCTFYDSVCHAADDKFNVCIFNITPVCFTSVYNDPLIKIELFTIAVIWKTVFITISLRIKSRGRTKEIFVFIHFRK